MCLAVPAKVMDIGPNNLAKVEIGGIEQEVSLDLLDGVKIGDYVIIHVGYALQKIDEDEARTTLALFDEIVSLGAPHVREVPQ